MTKSKTVSLREQLEDILGIQEEDKWNHADNCECYWCTIPDQIISAVLERIPEKMKEPTKEDIQEVFSMNMGYISKREIELSMRDMMQTWNQAIDETIKNLGD